MVSQSQRWLGPPERSEEPSYLSLLRAVSHSRQVQTAMFVFPERDQTRGQASAGSAPDAPMATN